jgi:hypothetical protein
VLKAGNVAASCARKMHEKQANAMASSRANLLFHRASVRQVIRETEALSWLGSLSNNRAKQNRVAFSGKSNDATWLNATCGKNGFRTHTIERPDVARERARALLHRPRGPDRSGTGPCLGHETELAVGPMRCAPVRLAHGADEGAGVGEGRERAPPCSRAVGDASCS